MSEKIIIKENKSLKLVNCLCRKLCQPNSTEINKALYMANEYILSKNAAQTGPLIYYSSVDVGSDGATSITLMSIMQITGEISCGSPYEFRSDIIEWDCLFARFAEQESNLTFAYQKLGVYAFENDIKLKGDSYTVYVKKESSGHLIADIFMPIKR